MSYIVLARKYRPQTFDEVVGQDHITGILKSALQSNRMAHSYLFCGPRGIGKTSCARILAKSLNCQKGPTIKPCGECSACREIAQTTSFDVIEIDGASNRGIDEIRTLRENVKFAPSYGRFKVYIVDEVHMLTNEAFNALLKTLEEPPECVKFVFATTAPNKVPDTIISRCQRFDFRRISIPVLTNKLSEICKTEKFKVDEDAIFALAKAAQGSLRDALGILDQLSAFSQRTIKAQDVYTMLGMVETDLLFEVTESLADKKCADALTVLDKIINQGKDIRQFNRDIIEHFRNLMVIKIGGKSLGKLIDYPVATKERILIQAQKFSLQNILSAIDIFVSAQETARVMDSLRIPIEIAFARLTCLQTTCEAASPKSLKVETSQAPDIQSKNQAAHQPFTPKVVLTNKKGHLDFSHDPDEDSQEDLSTGDDIDAVLMPTKLTLESVNQSWDAVTHAISRKKMSVATYLQEGTPYQVEENQLVINFPEHAQFHKETLEDKNNLKLIEQVFKEVLRTDVVIKFKIVTDYKPNKPDPIVESALKTFQGKVVNKWHNE